MIRVIEKRRKHICLFPKTLSSPGENFEDKRAFPPRDSPEGLQNCQQNHIFKIPAILRWQIFSGPQGFPPDTCF